MGSYAYPLSFSSISNLPGDLYFSSLGVVIYCDIGEIEVTPSRETISYTPDTCNNLIIRLAKVKKEAPKKQEALGGGMTKEERKEHFEKASQFMTPQEKAEMKNRPPPPPAPIGGRIRKKRSKKYYSSSSSSDSDSDFRPKRRTNNSALQQLLVANRDKEEKELKKSQLMINRHVAEEIKAIRDLRPADQRPLQKFSPYPVQGGAIKKLVGTKRGNRARGDIVAEVMKKEGLSLSQASKYVKEHDLY
jgi:hypothetical protein